MKFEFQTENEVYRTGPPARLLERKYGPKDFLIDAKGVRLESETDGVLEFETEWFRKWPKLQKAIQKAVDMTKEMESSAISPYDPTRRIFPFVVEHLRKFTQGEKIQGFWNQAPGKEGSKERWLASSEALETKIKGPHWFGRLQASEGILLEGYETLLLQHESQPTLDDTIRHAEALLTSANGGTLPGVELAKLRNFLLIVLHYIANGQKFSVKGGPSKTAFPLMNRTNFASIFIQLLPQKDRPMFAKMVTSGAVLKETSITKQTRIFKDGFGTHAHHVGPTVHEWLSGIVNGKDLLTSGQTTGISDAMGRYSVVTSDGAKNRWLVKFEVRASSMGTDMNISAVEAHAKKLFDLACRREQTALELVHKQGTTDQNALADFVFHSRHPELHRRKIRPGESKLIEEWTSIRDGIVQKLLNPRRAAGRGARR